MCQTQLHIEMCVRKEIIWGCMDACAYGCSKNTVAHNRLISEETLIFNVHYSWIRLEVSLVWLNKTFKARIRNLHIILHKKKSINSLKFSFYWAYVQFLLCHHLIYIEPFRWIYFKLIKYMCELRISNEFSNATHETAQINYTAGPVYSLVQLQIVYSQSHWTRVKRIRTHTQSSTVVWMPVDIIRVALCVVHTFAFTFYRLIAICVASFLSLYILRVFVCDLFHFFPSKFYSLLLFLGRVCLLAKTSPINTFAYAHGYVQKETSAF